MKRITLLVVLAAAAAFAVAAPLGASGEQEGRLVNAIRVQLTPTGTGTGEFAACCAVDDSGTVEVVFADADPGEFDATRTFVGTNGCTYVDRIRGKFGPEDSVRQIIRGHWRIVGGSGTCAGIRGGGTFVGVLDLETFTVKGTNVGGATVAG